MINHSPDYLKRKSSILPPNSPKYINVSNVSNVSNIVNTPKIKHIDLSDTYDLSDTTSDDRSILSDDKHLLWSSDSILTLSLIMNTINNHKLMKPIGHIVRYYINKHQPYDDKYKIRSVDFIPQNLDKKILILAYVCEIQIKKSLIYDTIITKNMIYSSIGKIFNEVIGDVFQYDSWELTYNEVFLINLLYDVLYNGGMSEGTSKRKSKSRDIVTTSYFISKYIIKYIEHSKDSILYNISTGVVRSQDLDISLFTSKQIRDILDTLDTKRRLYFRLLLVICEYMLHFDVDLIIKRIFILTDISNQKAFSIMLNDMMLEIAISITGYIIKINESNVI